MSLKIALTGSSGFLGRNLLPVLKNKHDNVFEIKRSNFNLLSKQSCDDIFLSIRPDVLIHAAGTVAGIGGNRENPGLFMYENLQMGINLIESARKNGIKKFIMIGTVCSYPKLTPIPFKEEYMWDGFPEETNAPYGVAKKTLMLMLKSYKQQYGLNITNLVPVNMYGPHDHFNYNNSHVIPAMILKFYEAAKKQKSEVALWGTGNASREFLFAPDCAEAICLAIEKDTDGSPINIGTGVEIKIRDLAEKIADKMGYDGNIVYDSSKPDGQPRRCLDTTKAISKLGFRAKTDFNTGLEKTIQWFKENEV